MAYKILLIISLFTISMSNYLKNVLVGFRCPSSTAQVVAIAHNKKNGVFYSNPSPEKNSDTNNKSPRQLSSEN